MNSHKVFSILILFWQKLGIKKWRCGFLGILLALLATNVANVEILLDTTALDQHNSDNTNRMIQ